MLWAETPLLTRKGCGIESAMRSACSVSAVCKVIRAPPVLGTSLREAVFPEMAWYTSEPGLGSCSSLSFPSNSRKRPTKNLQRYSGHHKITFVSVHKF